MWQNILKIVFELAIFCTAFLSLASLGSKETKDESNAFQDDLAHVLLVLYLCVVPFYALVTVAIKLTRVKFPQLMRDESNFLSLATPLRAERLAFASYTNGTARQSELALLREYFQRVENDIHAQQERWQVRTWI